MDNYINPNDTVPSVFDELQRPEYATTGQRFVNYLVDLVVIYIASIAFGIFLGLLAVMTKLKVSIVFCIACRQVY